LAINSWLDCPVKLDGLRHQACVLVDLPAAWFIAQWTLLPFFDSTHEPLEAF
jgi:hypothetical protein